jgi:hypothetical protein
MLYKFKSKATGDLIMTSANGDELMLAMGREPAAQGIVEVADMPRVITSVERAVNAAEAARRQAEAEAVADGRKLPPFDGVSLRQRVWPFIDMLRRAHAENAVVVWGV